MGWLSWTYQQTLDTPIWAIEMAITAKSDMLKACYGGGEDESNQSDEMRPATKKNVTAMFRALKAKGKAK